MNLQRILVVCVGNICRSPMAASLLQQALPGRDVSSAGLGALVGSDMDPVARSVALAHGHAVPQHKARQFTAALSQWADLILVMEARHREAVTEICPAARGKTMLLAQGMTPEDIPDPYRKSEAVHRAVQVTIEQACTNWVRRLR